MSNDPYKLPDNGESTDSGKRKSRFDRVERGLDYKYRGSISGRLVLGLLVVSLGVIFLAGNLEIIDSHAPLRYFLPAAFMAIGIAILIAPQSENGRRNDKRWGYVWLGIGLWTLANKAHWIEFGFLDLAFPLALVFIGSRLVQRAMNSNSSGGASNDQTRAYAFLSGSEMRTFTQPIKDSEVVAILSGIKLDLTNAQIDGDRATLQVTAVMGGIEIFAPSDWNIISDVMPILGAYVDKRRPTANVPTKTLIISGVVVMGGIEVKN